jgi:hypothetical protein
MAGKTKGEPTGARVAVTVDLLDTESRDTPDVHAYVFTRGGRLLAHSQVARGKVELPVEAATVPQSIQVVVGPQVEDDRTSVGELLRRGASRRYLRLEPRGDLVVDFVIPQLEWLCWLLSICSVNGTLTKSFERDGISVTAPVCGADVEVYEVDPWPLLVAKIPDAILERVRDVILGGPLPDPPFPEPPFPRPPFPEPPSPGPLPPFSLTSSTMSGIESDNIAAAENRSALGSADLATAEAIPSNLKFVAANSSLATLRSTITGYPLLIKPILCWIYPQIVTKQLVATTTTDDCGDFTAFFFRGCNNPDQPDLYFKAKQKFLFFDIPIYGPTPVACHTWWNYQCGTHVDLVTTHPLARTCAPCSTVEAPPKWVLAMAIGNLRLDRIHGTSTSMTSTPSQLGLTSSGAPFGGLCRLHLEFDSGDLLPAGVTHYRVQWRRVGDPGWNDLSGECLRHYIYEVDPTDPNTDVVIEPFVLGPETVGLSANLFKIPPVFPPKGQWSLPDPVEDVTNAKFPTSTLPPFGDPGLSEAQELVQQAGKYELKVDLYKSDGSRVTAPELASLGITYRVPEEETSTGVIPTEDASVLGLVADGSFHMTLHVDNNRCSAQIASPSVSGNTADGTCGVLEYATDSDVLSMPFVATHPNSFATYLFRLRRVDQTVVSQSGTVPGGSASAPVSDVLGACAIGGVASFAEHLKVWARATNGWRRLSEYDAEEVTSFVLVPTPPST